MRISDWSSDVCSSDLGDFGPTEEGFIRLWYTGPRNQTPREAGNLAMYFDRTGEFWTTSTTAIYDGNGRTTLGVSGLVRGWAAALDRAMATFDRLGAMQNRSVEFGINGLEFGRASCRERVCQ